MVRVDEVFSTSGLPPRSFIDRDWHDDIRLLKAALTRNGVVPCVWGESKSGKTSFLRRQLAQSGRPFVLVPGPHVKSADEFWRALGERLHIEVTREVQRAASQADTEAVAIKLESSLSAGLAKLTGSIEVQQAIQKIAGTTFKTEPIASVRSKCIEFLDTTKTIVVLDDFHHIEPSIRRDIAFGIRDPAEAEVTTFVLVSIEREAFDFIEGDEQLRGRFRIRQFPNWTKKELVEVARSGFGLLGLRATDGQLTLIAANAQLNPYNLQDICLTICSNAGIKCSTDIGARSNLDADVLEQSLKDFALELGYFHEIIARASAGTTESLKTYAVGSTKLNIYELALLAMSDIGAKEIVNLGTLRRRIRQRLGDPTWNNTYLKTALQRLADAEIDAKYQKLSSNKGTHPIMFNAAAEQLLIVNPLFRVYLFWCLPGKLGLESRTLDHLSEANDTA